MRVYK